MMTNKNCSTCKWGYLSAFNGWTCMDGWGSCGCPVDDETARGGCEDYAPDEDECPKN